MIALLAIMLDMVIHSERQVASAVQRERAHDEIAALFNQSNFCLCLTGLVGRAENSGETPRATGTSARAVQQHGITNGTASSASVRAREPGWAELMPLPGPASETRRGPAARPAGRFRR